MENFQNIDMYIKLGKLGIHFVKSAQLWGVFIYIIFLI